MKFIAQGPDRVQKGFLRLVIFIEYHRPRHCQCSLQKHEGGIWCSCIIHIDHKIPFNLKTGVKLLAFRDISIGDIVTE